MQPDVQKRTLLDKWRLVRAAARDNKRLSAGDIAVLLALCDRYGTKTQPDRPPMAGHALLGAMSGLSRRGTIDSTKRLIDAGYISVLQLGSGTRGTVYNLNFARGEADITTKADSTSGEPDCTTEVNQAAPLDTISGEAHFTESPLTCAPLQGGLHVVGSEFEAAPMAPPPVGLEATVAGPASGDDLDSRFSEFWAVCPRKHNKAKAKTAYRKINPDAALHSIIVSAAKAWTAHYRLHGTDARWIPEPANWLAGERWDEDLPIIHIDPKGAAIAKAKANALPKPSKASQTEEAGQPGVPLKADAINLKPAMMTGEISPFVEFGEFTAEIEAATVSEPEHGERVIRLDIDLGECRHTFHEFTIQSRNPEKQRLGREMLDTIIDATGASYPCTDTDELLFKSFKCSTGLVGAMFCISYEPIAANDNEPSEGVAAGA